MQHTCITRVQLPLPDDNNNRRRDVFCNEEEVRDGRLKREGTSGRKNGRGIRRSLKEKGDVNTGKDEKWRNSAGVMG